MDALTDKQIRRSMVNCSRGEADRMTVPFDITGLDWDSLDFLGWTDPKAPLRAYIVTWHDGEPVGIALRVADSQGTRRLAGLCGLCRSTRTGMVKLFTARRATKASQEWNSVGMYMCADLECSKYVRMEKATGDFMPDGTLGTEERSAGLRNRVGRFLGEVLSAG